MTNDAQNVAALGQLTGVNDPSIAYLAMEKARELPRTLMGGTTAMREAGPKFLPQEPAESTQAYQIRLSRTVLYNAYKKAVTDLTGKVFSKPVHCNKDTPDDIKAWCKNIDLAGRDLHTFAHDAFLEACAMGVSYVLVDFPRLTVGRTLDEERKVGARPYCVFYQAKDVIGWKSDRINGVDSLTQVRLKESSIIADGEYKEKIVKRVRVLQIADINGEQHCTFTVHEQQKGRDGREIWMVIPALSGVMSIDFIPVVPIYTNRTGFMTGTPPLIDLADLTALHWRSSSDQENILHFTRFPLLFGKCLRDDDSAIEIGPSRMIQATSDKADLKFVEHGGASIKAGKTALDDLEVQMNRMAMEPTVIGKAGTVTATEKAIDTSEAHSTLQSWALLLAGALDTILAYMGAWVGKKPQECGGVNVSTDYGMFLSGMDLPQLVQAFQSGLLSRETVWGELQRRGQLSDDFDPVEETHNLEKQQRQSPGPVGAGTLAAKILAGGTRPPDNGGPTLLNRPGAGLPGTPGI